MEQKPTVLKNENGIVITIPYASFVIGVNQVREYLTHSRYLPVSTTLDFGETRSFGEIFIPQKKIVSLGHGEFCVDVVKNATVSGLDDAIRRFIIESKEGDFGEAFMKNFIVPHSTQGCDLSAAAVKSVLTGKSYQSKDEVYRELMALADVPDWLNLSVEEQNAYDPLKGWEYDETLQRSEIPQVSL